MKASLKVTWISIFPVLLLASAWGADASPSLDARSCSRLAAGLIQPPTLPEDALAVPLLKQKTDYSCGARALNAVLQYWGVKPPGGERFMRKLLQTSRKYGTLPAKIAEGARKLGLQADLKERMSIDELRQALKEGSPVIILMKAWKDGHYVTLTGMDSRYVYFADPWVPRSYSYLPIKEFEERWHHAFDLGKGKKFPTQRLGIVIRGEKIYEFH